MPSGIIYTQAIQNLAESDLSSVGSIPEPIYPLLPAPLKSAGSRAITFRRLDWVSADLVEASRWSVMASRQNSRALSKLSISSFVKVSTCVSSYLGVGMPFLGPEKSKDWSYASCHDLWPAKNLTSPTVYGS